jgi:hypothetical protein
MAFRIGYLKFLSAGSSLELSLLVEKINGKLHLIKNFAREVLNIVIQYVKHFLFQVKVINCGQTKVQIPVKLTEFFCLQFLDHVFVGKVKVLFDNWFDG